jgi:hypothetical protein
MADFYGNMQGVANKLLAKFGQGGTIPRTVIAPPPNSWTPGEEVTTFHPVKLAVLPIDEKRIDGTMILTGDRQVLIAIDGLTIVPVVGDIVMFNGSFSAGVYAGEEWTVAKLDTLAPAGVSVMYDAVVRR